MRPLRTSARPDLRLIAGGIAALIAGGLALFLELWTVVPAPNLATLPLAVAIPELTPWALVWCVGAAAIAQFAARGWPRLVGLACSGLALGLALIPWCLLPSTLANCEREMRLGLGDGAGYGGAGSEPAAARALLHQPYSLGIALTGFPRSGGLRFRPDLPVRSRDGRRLGLDLYGPPTGGPHPTVIIIYGGAWIFGSRAASAELARSLAGLGYTAIAIDYRHAPVYEYPTQIDDVRDAMRSVAEHAKAWGVDTGRVAILGRSAGGELALLAAYERGPLTIRAAVGYYSPIDLVQGYLVPPNPDPADVDRILRAYIGGTPAERMGNYVAGSPIAHVRPGLPPTLLIGGGRDELVRLAFAHELRDALRSHGDRVVALDVPWSNHAFDSIPNGTGGQLARYYTERFLRATL